MWTGGVRVVVQFDDETILMVRQQHPEREIWLLPGGGIEEGETSRMAAVREVKEETSLDISVDRMLWHVEQLKNDGQQRYVNFFLAHVTGGELILGEDPEFDEAGQVLREVRKVSMDELADLPNVYPEFIRKELAPAISGSVSDPWKLRGPNE
jgi:ADP-ribose pyrophosphatase YjhB (NUDIX family)